MAANENTCLLVFLEVINANNLPKADRLSASDPFVEVTLVFLGKNVSGMEKPMPISKTGRTRVIKDCANPNWDAPMAFRLVDESVSPSNIAVLFRVLDQDGAGSELLSETVLPLSVLDLDEDVTFALVPQPRFAKHTGATLCVRRHTEPPGFVVEVVRLSNCPKHDLLSESDPYCLLSLFDASKKREKGAVFATAVKNDSKNATFHEFAGFLAHPRPDDVLSITIFDEDYGKNDDLVGRLQVPVAQLLADADAANGQAVPYPVPKASDCHLHLRALPRLRHGREPIRRRLYFIRHGESVWNMASERRDLGGMMAYDHPLSGLGIGQAAAFNARWKADQSSDSTRDFLAASHCFASPLTRAFQTCIVALKDHPLLASSSIRLLSSAREVKTLVGMDTVGIAFGHDAILDRARRLTALHTSPEELESYFAQLNIDAYQCESQWWSDRKESAADVHQRFTSFLSSMLYFPAASLSSSSSSFSSSTMTTDLPTSSSAIVVGHSIFIRNFCREFLAADRRDLVMFGKKKLSNAGCIAVDLEWDLCQLQSDRPVIRDIRLLFGSTLLDEVPAEEEQQLK